MHLVETGPDSWFNLPRAGGVAYAAQESWVMNATIKVSTFTPSEEDTTLTSVMSSGRIILSSSLPSTKIATLKVGPSLTKQEVRYEISSSCTVFDAVIHQCGLMHDLSLFNAGDETEIGERGVTLSGGQKVY